MTLTIYTNFHSLFLRMLHIKFGFDSEKMFEYYGHTHVYSPGQGQTTLWAQKSFININRLSICSFRASFLPLNDIFLFFPIQMLGRPKMTLLLKGQGHPKVMIYTNFVELHHLILHAKFQNHRPCGSGEEDF